MQGLLDRLTNTVRKKLPYVEPRYSRKTKRITLTVYLGDLPVQVSLPLKQLDTAIDSICAESYRTGHVQSLLDELLRELLYAWQEYGHFIEGKKKPKGKQARRRMILIRLKYASAWAYEFVTQEWEKPAQDRFLPLQRAADRFKIEAGRTCRDPIEMVAFLVFHSYKDERKKHSIKTPWDDWGDFSAENYARRYIKTEVGRRIAARVRKKRTLLCPLPRQALVFHNGDNFQEVWKIACRNGRLRNPLLQKIFAPWSDA